MTVDVRSRLIDRAKRRRDRQIKLHRITKTFKVGDEVLLKNHQLPGSLEGIMRKLLLIYVGPYIIAQVKGNNTYELVEPTSKRTKGVYNHNQLKPFFNSQSVR